MTDTPEDNEVRDKEAVTAKSMINKASETLETANTTAKNAGQVLNTIKWVAIAVVTLIFFFVGYSVYKMIAAPAAAVGGAVEGVSDAVKSGSEAVAEGTSNIVNRLDIPAADQRRLNELSEKAFQALANLTPTEPEGIKDRMFRSTNLAGNDGRVCQLRIDFGNGEIDIHTAADNEAYETSRALGSTDNRLMRIIIQAGDEDIPINAIWDEASKNWAMKWKRTTLTKPVSDQVAQSRVLDVLRAVPKQCN